MKYFFVLLWCVIVSSVNCYGLIRFPGNGFPVVAYNDIIFTDSLITDSKIQSEVPAIQDPTGRKNQLQRRGSNLSALVDKKSSELFDRRYVVYENRTMKNGLVKAVKTGYVKSMKSAAQSGSLHDTRFYQIAGKRINTGNSFIERKQGTGINLAAGKTFDGFSGMTGRFEYYFSRNLGDMILPGKTGKGMTSVKFYFEGGYEKGTYSLMNNPENFTLKRGSFGIGKDYYPLRFLHWGPFGGYGMEFARWENSDNLISTNFAEFGARLGINLHHNVQVIGSATYYFLISSVMMDGNKDVVDPDFDYLNLFPERTGFGYNIGLRIML